MTTRRSPGDLAAAWAALPVCISSIEVSPSAVHLADYPGGPRPSSVVRISGAGQEGFGENVSFTQEEHDRFTLRAPALLTRGTPTATGNGVTLVGSWVGHMARAAWWARSPYDSAALEAAFVDLAMRQAGLSLGAMAGVEEGAPLRHVVSFAACADPRERVRQLRAAGYGGGLKIDVDPSWDRSTQAELAREPGIAILDFKGRGTASSAAQLAVLFPEAIFEDPPPGTSHARISRDMSINDADAAMAAASRAEAVNLKAPRMGGPFEVLKALQLILSRAAHLALPPAVPTSYFGGMFEIGVGRAQARQLAALYCGDAPNDLALNIGMERAENAPVAPLVSSTVIRLDNPGFGTL